ncbi:MAG: S24 family peptidase, partial [Oscillospiraceae bacterium]|nr:S24 family peptidase [Oscillospiraceae bacterium]
EKKSKKITPTDAELEAALLEAYRTFPEDVRRDFLDSIRNAVLAERGDIQCITKRFISNRVSAGFGAILDDSENWETVLVPLTNDSRDADFILRVCGDSMEPEYSDGDYVLVKQQDTIEQGEIGIFCVDGEGYIKQLGNNVLISLNKKYPEIPLDDSSRCFGIVLGKTELI